MKKRTGTIIGVIVILCVLCLAGVIAVRYVKSRAADGETPQGYTEENKKMLNEAVKIKDKYAGQIVKQLEKLEPGCRFVKVYETGELDGGLLICVITDSGKQYGVNTSTSGELANITDMSTGEMLYAASIEDEDDEEYIDYRAMNEDMLTTYGIESGRVSAEEAGKAAEWLNRVAPGELITNFTISATDEGKLFHVVTDTGKVFNITVLETGDVRVIEEY